MEAVMSESTEKEQANNLWHAQQIDSVLSRLDSTQNGLTEPQAQQRLAQFGANSLPEPKPRSAFERFLSQFHNILIYVLLFAAVVTAVLQHWIDAGVILAVVLVNAIIGYIQEGKAEDALKAIKNMLSPQAMVLRDGQRKQIAAEDLVVGDVVVLQSGDRVPADIRLFHTKDLQIQEATLTGESLPVVKQTNSLDETTVLAERDCMAFSSTLVSFGQGTGVVVATGKLTEIGRISALLSEVEMVITPLVKQITSFGHVLTMAILVIATITMLFGVLVHQYSLSYMFLSAVGLAVAAIPEGLPAIMTITLAIGVQRMAKRHAIIRRLPAIETLGALTVICSDKTGTLTCNEMTACNVMTSDMNMIEVTGAGYDPHGDFRYQGKAIDVEQHDALSELMRAVLLCNDARIEQRNESWILHGDPTEGALVTLAMKAGLETSFESEAWLRKDVIPFESQHQFMATLHHSHEQQSICYVKGAPEQILSMCQTDEDADKHQAWLEKIHQLASQGQRVLAVAVKKFESEKAGISFADVEQGLTLLGIVGMIDPPRPEVINAIKECQTAGVKVKMITGDHQTTAQAIGEQLGIGNGNNVLTGQSIEQLTDEQLDTAVEEVDVFARATPEHKLRLVQALQRKGHVVAMTGDGVNDAPALKRADVGTAMGIMGTEVAKDAAEMVLADDNFASIVDAVEEGRTVYDNLKKAILFILPTNGGEALIIIAAILFGQTLPITPVQILWVNMITAVTLALALAFEPPEKNVMHRPPHEPAEAILTKALVWRIAFVSVILMLGTFALFIWGQNSYQDDDVARTIAVNTLVMFEIFYLFNSRFITEPVLNKQGLLGNKYALMAIVVLLGFQLLYTYNPLMQTLFASQALDLQSWGLIVLVASSVLWLVEIEKWWVKAK
jgi:magnesium-transporting ATPase (P-type)